MAAAALPAAGMALEMAPQIAAFGPQFIDASREAFVASRKYYDEAARFLNQKFKMAFMGFDAEKVFWQIAFTEGIILIAKIVYEVYKAVRFFLIDPWGAIAGGLNWITSPVTAPIVGGLKYIGLWQFIFGEDEPPTPEQLEQLREDALDKIGVPLIIDQIFNEYLGWLLGAGVAIPILIEYRRVKKLARNEF